MTARDLDYMLDLWEVKRAADQEIKDMAYSPYGGRSSYGNQDPTSSKALHVSKAFDRSEKCRRKLQELSRRLDRLLKTQDDAFAAAIIKAEYIDGHYYADVMKVAEAMEEDAKERRKAVLRNILNIEESM